MNETKNIRGLMEKHNLGGFYYWTITYILARKFQTA
jgi:hypothetical protein